MNTEKNTKRGGKCATSQGKSAGGSMQAKKKKSEPVVLGKTVEGIVIYEPNFAPTKATKAQIRRAVKTVKQQRSEKDVVEILNASKEPLTKGEDAPAAAHGASGEKAAASAASARRN